MRKCAAQHFGPWMIEPLWFSSAIASVQAGTWQASGLSDGEAEPVFSMAGDIAIIPLHGHITKGRSSYGGTSSVDVRSAIRGLAADPAVAGIMLHIDSPGGTAAGTAELADDVYAAGKAKPVHTHADDLMASAGAFVGLQASRVTVNRAGEVGSFGTVAMLHDTSGMMEAAGVKVHVVSTGPHKGAFAPGTPITDEQIAYAREMVESINEPFLQGVMRGRGMSAAKAKALFFGDDGGKVFSSGRALELGIVDAVESFDAAMQGLRKAIRQRQVEARKMADKRDRRMQLAKALDTERQD